MEKNSCPGPGFLIAELVTALALLMVLSTVFMGFVGSITRQERETEQLLQAVTRIQSRYPDHELPPNFRFKVQAVELPTPEGINAHMHERIVRETKPKLLKITWEEGNKERVISCIRAGEYV